MVGRAIGAQRDKWVLATKFGFTANPNPGPNERGISRKWIYQAVEASLKRLGSDYIDIIYFHVPVIGAPLEDVAYQSNTQEFWNACSAICDERDWRMGGSFFDGKGQPSQVSAVSHGSSTTRFNGVNVINTARKIG